MCRINLMIKAPMAVLEERINDLFYKFNFVFPIYLFPIYIFQI
jgi:hypothetical protein